MREFNLPLILQLRHLKRKQLRFGDLRDHVRKLFLHELVAGDRLVVKLFAYLGVLQGFVIAGHCRSDRAPADPVPGLIEATEGALETFDVGEYIAGRNAHVLESKGAGYGSAQGPFPLDIPRRKAWRALFHQKAPDSIFGTRPAMVPEVIQAFSPLRT